MKNLFYFLILSQLLFLPAQAQEFKNEIVRGHDSAQVNLKYYQVRGAVTRFVNGGSSRVREENRLVRSNVSVLGQFFANGKLNIHLKFNGVYGCAGFNLALIGQTNGFGIFNLYNSVEDLAAGNSIANLSRFGDEVLITLTQDFALQSPGVKATECTWSFPVYSEISFEVESETESGK